MFRQTRITALLLLIASVILCVSNSKFTFLDDESTIIAVAGHPVAPTLGLFILGKGQHEHPPLSDIVLHAWLIATNYSFPLLRVFANVFYLAGLIFVALSSQLLYGEKGYWAALSIGLVWPFCFQYGRICGWYAFCWFLIAVITWLYLSILRDGTDRHWISLGIASILLIWSNYFGVAVLILLLSHFLLLHRNLARRHIRPIAFIVAAGAISCLPFLWIVLSNIADHASKIAGPFQPKQIVAIAGYPLFSVFASTAVAPWYLPISIPVAIAIFLLLASVWISAGRTWIVLWAISLTLLALSGHMDVKRMLFLLPWFFIALASAVSSPEHKVRWCAVVSCSALILAGWTGIFLGNHYATSNLYEPWQDVVKAVAVDAHQGATIISDNYVFFFYLNYELNLQKMSKFSDGVYLGEARYRTAGYSILSAINHASSPAIHGPTVLVEGTSNVADINAMKAIDADLESRCVVRREFNAAPDPALSFKAEYSKFAPALKYRTIVRWMDCP